ncbi:MAG TPA: hypothetical protein VGX26_05340 [Solirubrobacteraceae bacterium]|nr:hypothetical protein [Solirubrobacteraceae bacterium]
MTAVRRTCAGWESHMHGRQSTKCGRSLRGAFTCFALLVLALALLAPVAASAAPAVTFKSTALPIPGFPGTGDILGAGTEVEVESTITGTEYGGFPSPLVLLTIDSPAGTKVDSNGFATCAQAVLEADGPRGCPKKSRAGPVGEGLGIVSFGHEQVREKVSIQGFFAPGNTLIFFVDGTTPTSLEIIEKAHWVSGPAPFGPEAIVELPLVETVPGALDASILSFKVTVGAAYKKGKKTVSYITLPKKCPRGGFLLKSQFKFYSGESTTVTYKPPCPKK